MRTFSIAIATAVCAVVIEPTGVVGLASSSANAAPSDCRSIVDPMKRVACYDKAVDATLPSGKPSAIKPVLGAAYNAAPATLPIKANPPIESGPRFWLEADGGIYGFSKNLPVLAVTAAPSTGPTPIPTAPGFIGLVTTTTVTDPLISGTPATFGGGGNFRMGYWLDPARTMAIDGSAFFVQGNSSFGLSTTNITRTFVNTTPDTFVGLHDDATTTTLKGAITDRFYGADLNYRIKASPNFDVMAGVRYTALDEKLSASIDSAFSSTFRPELGIPPPVNFSNSSSGSATFRIRNDFIGPQIGFNAEQHWGRYWAANETKVAVGAIIERVSVSGSSVSNVTPTTGFVLAGIPLTGNGGFGTGVAATPVTTTGGQIPFGLFAQGNRSKTVFAVVPSGTIKGGYDVTPNTSLTVAYNYLYMSSVGRVGDQIASPFDIRQSSIFLHGITVGTKTRF
jgi:hypothetical protein